MQEASTRPLGSDFPPHTRRGVHPRLRGRLEQATIPLELTRQMEESERLATEIFQWTTHLAMEQGSMAHDLSTLELILGCDADPCSVSGAVCSTFVLTGKNVELLVPGKTEDILLKRARAATTEGQTLCICYTFQVQTIPASLILLEGYPPNMQHRVFSTLSTEKKACLVLNHVGFPSVVISNTCATDSRFIVLYDTRQQQRTPFYSRRTPKNDPTSSSFLRQLQFFQEKLRLIQSAIPGKSKI